MSINSIRKFPYLLARILGDMNALNRGKPGKRIARRATGKATGKLLKKLFR